VTPEKVLQVAECIAAVRTLAECKHKGVPDLKEEIPVWCPRCGAIRMDGKWHLAMVVEWSKTVDFEGLT
jgi:hypothetical protein